ncbi:hypothetical protein [Nocardiopsis alborubida]|uniref:Uncharacterized protein n=1 Tax=Nocardiopsis alborubida TaxID=146802 RepID=A0A7X6RS98_9ACTN|nr:hypothetical protein [Nocardiopsis alborubida]NKZ00077.1 hypothetical protein [Nocardiopsis alborubida]
MELRSHHVRALVGSAEARAVDLCVRGGAVTAVYRPVAEQGRLRAGGSRVLGSRLGLYQVLQALPLGEWVPVDALTEREQRILPALPAWTRSRRSGRVLRIADTPVRLDLLVTRGEGWLDALDRACVLGPVAPRTAVCPPLGEDRERACLEADFYGVGLAELDGDGVRVLVRPRTEVPESAAALRWRLAERVHRAVEERNSSSLFPAQ